MTGSAVAPATVTVCSGSSASSASESVKPCFSSSLSVGSLARSVSNTESSTSSSRFFAATASSPAAGAAARLALGSGLLRCGLLGRRLLGGGLLGRLLDRAAFFAAAFLAGAATALTGRPSSPPSWPEPATDDGSGALGDRSGDLLAAGWRRGGLGRHGHGDSLQREVFHQRLVLSRLTSAASKASRTCSGLTPGQRPVLWSIKLDDSGVRKQCFRQCAGRARGHEQPLVGRSRARQDPFTSRCRASIVTRLEPCSSQRARVSAGLAQCRVQDVERHASRSASLTPPNPTTRPSATTCCGSSRPGSRPRRQPSAAAATTLSATSGGVAASGTCLRRRCPSTPNGASRAAHAAGSARRTRGGPTGSAGRR